jgi:hypothetical protein
MTQSLTIQGITFEAPAPYSEGHVLTANEALALNQVYGENLRNNFATHIKKVQEGFAKEAGVESYTLTQSDIEELRVKFAEYAEGYEFHGKRTARQPVDPVAREARKLAKDVVRSKLNEKGIDVKTLAEGKMDELIDAVLVKMPEITEEARRRVEATKAAAANVLDGLI